MTAQMAIAGLDERRETLTQALARHGCTHEPGVRAMARRVMRDGVEVFHGDSKEVWAWLRGGGDGEK